MLTYPLPDSYNPRDLVTLAEHLLALSPAWVPAERAVSVIEHLLDMPDEDPQYAVLVSRLIAQYEITLVALVQA